MDDFVMDAVMDAVIIAWLLYWPHAQTSEKHCGNDHGNWVATGNHHVGEAAENMVPIVPKNLMFVYTHSHKYSWYDPLEWQYLGANPPFLEKPFLII